MRVIVTEVYSDSTNHWGKAIKHGRESSSDYIVYMQPLPAKHRAKPSVAPHSFQDEVQVPSWYPALFSLPLHTPHTLTYCSSQENHLLSFSRPVIQIHPLSGICPKYIILYIYKYCKMTSVGTGCGSVVECLLSMLRALGPMSSIKNRNNNNSVKATPATHSATQQPHSAGQCYV